LVGEALKAYMPTYFKGKALNFHRNRRLFKMMVLIFNFSFRVGGQRFVHNPLMGSYKKVVDQ
jgi:hypothetical protein